MEQQPMVGDADNWVVDPAHGLGNGLVVMTTHSRFGIGRSVLGSVADQVVRHSGEPVLVIRSR